MIPGFPLISKFCRANRSSPRTEKSNVEWSPCSKVEKFRQKLWIAFEDYFEESGRTRSDKTSIEDGLLPALVRPGTWRASAHRKALCQGALRSKVYHFTDRESGSAEPLRSISAADRKAVGFGIERPTDLSGPLEKIPSKLFPKVVHFKPLGDI